jgi:ribosomal-protein-alanine acetyltransferase
VKVPPKPEEGVQPQLNLRPLKGADAAQIAKLELITPEAAQWGAGGYQQLGIGELIGFGAEGKVELLGFIIARIAADEMEILNLAVSVRTRRQGIAAKMLGAAMAAGKERGAKGAFLEVRESNAGARCFYQSQGFTESGRRKGYYSQPYDDALVLTRLLT